MSYTPNIPQPGDKPSVSQGQILANFQTLNTIFGINHYEFNSGANAGKHKIVSLVGNSPILTPIPINQEGIVLIANIAGSRFALSYVERSSGITHETVQLTAKTAPLTAPIGRSFLPGMTSVFNQSMGMIIQWGSKNIPTGTSTSISFAPAFDAAPYTIQVTMTKSASGDAQPVNIVDGSVTASGFSVYHTASGAHDIYWLAIGREQV